MFSKSKSLGAAAFRTSMSSSSSSHHHHNATNGATTTPSSSSPHATAMSDYPTTAEGGGGTESTASIPEHRTRQLSRVHRTITHRQTKSSLPNEFFFSSSSSGQGGSTTTAASTIIATNNSMRMIPPEYRRGRSSSLRALSGLVGGGGFGLGISSKSLGNEESHNASAARGGGGQEEEEEECCGTAHPNITPTTTASSSSSCCNFLSLLIGAIGVVFGDIGTSPLYTLNTVLANIPLFKGTDMTKVNRSEIVVATYCLMFYTLVWVVLIKYVLWVMRVHHHGAGGELAMAQVILKGLDPTLVEGDKVRDYTLPLLPNGSSGGGGEDSAEKNGDEQKVSSQLPPIPSGGPLEMMNRNDDDNTSEKKYEKDTTTTVNNGNYHYHVPNNTSPPPPPSSSQSLFSSSGVRKRSTLVMTIAMMSTGFLIGDGVITPPNTVLGALHSPVLAEISTSLNVLISCLVLIFIFNVQKFGSKAIGFISGPIMIIWFLTLAILGGMAVGRYPEEAKFLVRAFNPAVLAEFSGGEEGEYPPSVGFYNAFLSLSGVILCITGAEALYADLGHFGYSAIMVAWVAIIFPALALHYFGQCCYVISLGRDMELYPPELAGTEEYQALVSTRELFNTQLIEVPGNLVYALVPTQDMSPKAGEACLWLLTIVAVLASIIASQALISGVFSILTQAYALDLMPRMTILHTNPDEKGQVFIGEANTMMCIVCVIIVLLFQTSDRLTAAYGIAVAFCMFFTDILMGFVMNWVWRFHWIVAIACCVPFVFVDGLFLSANILKLGEGAESWISIIIAFVAWFCMQAHWWTKTTVKVKAGTTTEGSGAGRLEVMPDSAAVIDATMEEKTKMTLTSAAATSSGSGDIDHLLRLLNESKLLKRMPVAGVFLTPYPKTYPRCLSTLARSMAALPETIVLLHISFSRDKPYVAEEERYDLICHSEDLGVYSLNMYFGYAEPITADHFDVNNSLQEIFQSEGYAALRKLTEDRGGTTTSTQGTRSASNWARVNASLTESILLAPFEESDTEPASSSSRDCHHWTYFLGVRKYIPHSNESVFIKLFVHTCDFLSRNSKSSRDFFGLTSVDTIEVNCATVIRSKNLPPSEGVAEEEEMVELVVLQ